MKPTPETRGRKPLAADVVRLELRLPKALATLAEEAAKREGIVTAEWWRRAAHARLGQPRLTRGTTPGASPQQEQA